MTSAYAELKDKLVSINLINKASALLGWDQEVMMPPEAGEERSQILATLSTLVHEKSTNPKIGELIKAAEGKVTAAEDQRNLKFISQDYLISKNTPEKLVYESSETRSKLVAVWQEAKPTNDWKAVQPLLEKLFSLTKEKAEIASDILKCPLYDAQLYHYARGNTQKVIDPLFAMLKEKLPPLVQEIVSVQSKNPPLEIAHFSIENQEKVSRILAEKIRYSFSRGRLDTAAHPFSGGTKNDSRITNRYSEEEPFTSLYGVMHEVGHALYTQNLPQEWDGQPVGWDSDLSIHESQSLITEKQAGLNEGFIGYLHKLIQENDQSFSMSLGGFKQTLYKVQPSFIRVDADEATYPLHVVLRYEIEKKLFNGDIQVADIPELWNVEFKKLLGIDVPAHNVGCMQDIHWYWGLFGYFPTYTQGALYAAQLFAAMKRDIPSVEQDLAQGDLTAFNGWLTDKIHRWGQIYDAPELIRRATGEAPTAEYFLNHLKNRYL